MRLRQVVESYRGRLTATDQRLIRELLANPTEAAFFSAAQLAEKVQAHPASAVRLAKKLGYAGYPDLRQSFQLELTTPFRPSKTGRKRARAEEQGVLQTLVQGEIAALNELGRHVGRKQLETAARRIFSAHRVFLFARGHATTLVELMGRNLRSSGLVTVDLRAEGRDLAERVVALKDRDVVLAFAFETTPPGLVRLLEHAAVVGADTILISDLLGPMVRPTPNILLAAPLSHDREYRSLAVPMAIADALALTVAGIDGRGSHDAQQRLVDLLERFNSGEERGRGRQPQARDAAEQKR